MAIFLTLSLLSISLFKPFSHTALHRTALLYVAHTFYHILPYCTYRRQKRKSHKYIQQSVNGAKHTTVKRTLAGFT